jgi:hypothetical protein
MFVKGSTGVVAQAAEGDHERSRVQRSCPVVTVFRDLLTLPVCENIRQAACRNP